MVAVGAGAGMCARADMAAIRCSRSCSSEPATSRCLCPAARRSSCGAAPPFPDWAKAPPLPARLGHCALAALGRQAGIGIEGRRVGHRQRHVIGREARHRPAAKSAGRHRRCRRSMSSPGTADASIRRCGLVRHRDLIGGGRHHLDDVEAVLLQLLRAGRATPPPSSGGCRATAKCPCRALRGGSAPAQMIWAGVMWRCQSSATMSAVKTIKPARGKLALERCRSAPRPGMRKNGARYLGSPPSAAPTSAMPPSISARMLSIGNCPKPHRMMVAVGADGVAGLVDAAHRGGKGAGHLADHEIRRLDALRGENVEDLVGIGRQRAVVEGEDDLLIVQRQRVRILHACRAAGIALKSIGSTRLVPSASGFPGQAATRSCAWFCAWSWTWFGRLVFELDPGPGLGLVLSLILRRRSWARAATAASGATTAVARAAANKPALNLRIPSPRSPETLPGPPTLRRNNRNRLG